MYFLFKRFLQMILTVIVGISLMVFLLKFLPGIPNQEFSAVHIQDFELPWNQPLWLFWKNYLQGNWGHSLTSPDILVIDLINRESKYTLLMGFCAFLFSYLVGLALALVSVLYSAFAWLNKTLFVLSTFFLSMPSFLTAPLFIFLFSVYWKLLPSALWQGPISLVLPVLVLSLKPIFYIFRLFTNQMEEIKFKDYIRTAKAKGVPSWKIVFFHQGKNAISVIFAYMSSLAVYLVSSSFVVETFFALPGWGSLFVRSVSERDYSVILGLCFSLTIVVQLFQILSDFLVYKISPHLFQEYQ